EHIRGVASDGVVRNLLEKKLVTMKGRARTVGRPLQYGTTSEFLKFFGLANLEDLPLMSEIVEMISAREPQPQTELNLPDASEARVSLKLNVADGTYDPNSDRDTDNADPVTPVPSDLDKSFVLSDGADEVDKQDRVVPSGEDTDPAGEENETKPGVKIDIDTTN
ncbi:MAG: SMC-Scp complex subunit ScpB, partial [candidate division Zixibacteria bacterium]|nr:SMC-Scp complex subunit ScpB [candidate division Zixibacteria bacterium]